MHVKPSHILACGLVIICILVIALLTICFVDVNNSVSKFNNTLCRNVYCHVVTEDECLEHEDFIKADGTHNCCDRCTSYPVIFENIGGLNISYETRYFTQKVDHFSYANNDKFQQRFLISVEHWNKSSGPIFFYTGNEGDIITFAENTGFVWEIAPEFQAMVVFAEHRYYGTTQPYGNKSFESPQYSGYLTSEQALVDFATLIQFIKQSTPGAQSSPVVAFGGSYGGMLSSWLRMKYPHIIIGALASSAPVAWFENLTSCGAFSQTVTQAFSVDYPQCSKSIRMSWDVIRKIGMSEAGRNKLSESFHLCSDFNNTDALVGFLNEAWGSLAMINYPYSTNFLAPVPAYPVKAACEFLKIPPKSDEELLYNVYLALSVFHNYTGNASCFDLNKPDGSSISSDGWDYQACTEMVMPMCSDGVNDMFEPEEWNLDGYSKECNSAWSVFPEPQKAVLMYGGRNISAASNIIFSNGLLDPWHPGGVLNSTSEAITTIMIKDGAHHLDLRSSNPLDPISVTNARNLEKKIISEWISGYYKS